MSQLARSAVLEGFAAAATGLGLSPEALLRAEGLSSGILTDPDQRLPTEKTAMLLERAARESGALDFALRMAEHRRTSVLGPVRLLMREQASVRAAITALARFFWAQAEGVEFVLEDDGEIAVLRLALDPSLAQIGYQSSELIMAALIAMLRELLGSDWRPEMVLFTHPRPPSLARHLVCFGRVPMFGQDMTALVLTSTELARRLEGTDPATAALVERLIGQAGPGPNASEAGRVRLLIRELLPRGQCRADVVAHRLGIDRRTLHRRLAREQTGFAALLHEVRLEMLAAEPDRSKTELAGLLGFSSLSAFSRWRRPAPAPAPRALGQAAPPDRHGPASR